MELRHYINLLRKWLWLIVLCTVIAGTAAYLFSRQQTPIYEATSTILINQARSPVRGTEYADILTSERVARTYAELLQDWPVVELTASQLGFDQDFETIADAYQIALAVDPIRDTQLIELRVEASSPDLAARIANTLPDVFRETNLQRQRERYDVTRGELQAELATVEADMVATQEAIDRLGDAETAEAKAALGRLQSTLRRYEASYSSLLSSLEELRLSEVQTSDNIVLATPAQVPEDPVRPRPLLNGLLAALVGAMLAVGAALLIEYLDDTVKTPEDVRDVSTLPTLAGVMALNGTTPQRRMIAATDPRSPQAEAYRVLRTNLQFTSLDKPLRSLLISSPGPGEGKSTTVANLGIVMAQAGNRVLLIDADLRRPTLHKLFQLPNGVGLTTALFQIDQPVDWCIQDTGQANLSVLTTGPIPPNPAELLGSERMHQFLQQLEQTYDFLLIDSPPVLAVTDAAILSNQADGIVLVVSAGVTRFDMLARAMERLDSVGGRPLGVVLNRLTERASDGYYYEYQVASQYSSGDDQGDGTGDQRPANGRLRRTRSPKTTGQVS